MEYNTLQATRLSSEEGDKYVVWSLVSDVSYLIVDGKRQVVLEYKDGSRRYLERHQARDLWHEVEQHDGCAFPCYYRHEADTAPASCTDCKLSEILLGVACKTRPDPIPPRDTRKIWDWRNTLIVCMLTIIYLLLVLIETKRSPTPPQHPNAPAHTPARPPVR